MEKRQQKKSADSEKLIEEYTETLKRLQADFENYIKRAEKEKSDFANYSNYKLINQLLPIMDDFEKALEVLNEKGSDELIQGVELIYKRMAKVLENEGVKPIETLGQKLDPFRHEVIDIINSDADEVITKELQKGYTIKDRVLRAAKVQISKTGVEENVSA